MPLNCGSPESLPGSRAKVAANDVQCPAHESCRLGVVVWRGRGRQLGRFGVFEPLDFRVADQSILPTLLTKEIHEAAMKDRPEPAAKGVAGPAALKLVNAGG